MFCSRENLEIFTLVEDSQEWENSNQNLMPSSFAANVVNDSRSVTRTKRAPPKISNSGSTGETDEDSCYEEIESLHNYSNISSTTGMDSGERMNGNGSCSLCGSLNPVVRCEMCNNQIFCGSCNDMFHRHPKRHNHSRVLLECYENIPPLPPKSHEMIQAPIPPPRRNKKFGFLRSANASPTPFKSFDPMGSLKRLVGLGGGGDGLVQRTQNQFLNQKGRTQSFSTQGSGFQTVGTIGRNTQGNRALMVNQFNNEFHRRQSAPFSSTTFNQHRVFPIPSYRQQQLVTNRNGLQESIPLTVLELGNKFYQPEIPHQQHYPQQFEQVQRFGSISTRSGLNGTQQNASKQRAFSITNLEHLPASTVADASHFATMQRRPQPRPLPPIPPKDFSPIPARKLYPSASTSQLSHAFVPWINRNVQLEHISNHESQQGYPHESPLPSPPHQQYRRNSNEWGITRVEQAFEHKPVDTYPTYTNQGIIAEPPPVPPHNPPPLVPKKQHVPQSPALIRLPPTPKPEVSLKDEPEYYDGDEEKEDIDEPQSSEVAELDELTEAPDGPWSCEHCTFINPKSSKICTICCKTPIKGYRMIPSKTSYETPNFPKKKLDSREQNKQNVGEKEASTGVVQSKLSFSNSKDQPVQAINVSTIRKQTSATSPITVSGSSESSELEESNFSSSDNQGEELLTEKHRYFVKESKFHAVRQGSAPPPSTQRWDQPKMLSVGTGTPKMKTKVYHNSKRDQEPFLYKTEEANTSKRQQSRCRSVSSNSSRRSNMKEKTSKGTSPPPQTISTQTYEELPPPSRSRSRQPQQLGSKTSLQESSNYSRDPTPHRIIEMSDKALRYARRAQQHHNLKRSMSAHLTSSGGSSDPWPRNQNRQGHHDSRYMYSSRHSLASDTRSLPVSGPPSRDTSPPSSRNNSYNEYGDDLRRFEDTSWENFPSPADYFASIEDLVRRKRKDSMKSQELELSKLLKEAEELNYSPEDLQVAMRMCGGDRNPIRWLEENWASMIETVQMLATKYGRDKGQDLNEIGTISSAEAKISLRVHRGNVWAAVTECVEQRRKKFLELQSRGNFLREDILTALTANHGNMEAAYLELSKAQLKPFLMRIWGPPIGKENESLPPPRSKSPSVMNELNEATLTCSTVNGIERNQEPRKEMTTPSKQDQPIISEEKTLETIQLEPNVTSKVEKEEDTFYELEPQAAKSGSISEEDSEAIVSNFIQNYQVPPPEQFPTKFEATAIPKKILNHIEVELKSDQQLTQMNLAKYDESEAGLSEKLVQSQSNDTSRETLTTLTEAVNVIAGKLDVLLKTHQNDGIKGSTAEISISNQATEENKSGNTKEYADKSDGSRFELSFNQADNVSKVQLASDPLKPPKIELITQTPKQEISSSFSLLNKYQSKGTNDQVKGYTNGMLAYDKTQLSTSQGNLNMPWSSQSSTSNKNTDLQSNKESSSSSKIYQVLGTLGSLINRTTTFSAASSTTDRTKPESLYQELTPKESGYESVNVTHGQLQLPTRTNELLSEILQRKIDAAIEEALQNVVISETSNSVTPILLNNKINDSKASVEEVVNSEINTHPTESMNKSGSLSEHLDQRQLKYIHSIDDGKSEQNSSEDEFANEDLIDESDEFESHDLDGNSIALDEGDTIFVDIEDEPSTMENFEENAVLIPIESKMDLHEKEQIIPSSSETKTISVSNDEKGERKVDMLLKSGHVDSIEKADLAVKLMDMDFTEEDSVYAANECSSLYTAISFLQQECLLCSGKFSAKQMVSMLSCNHGCCRNCASEWFMVQIRDHSILDATCPFCKEPTNIGDDSDQATEYFSHLEILLKELLSEHYHEMFSRKLRDWTLAKTPNFKWCSKCSSGFITEPLQTHLICPDCNTVTCAICLEPWDKVNHHHQDRVRTQVFCDETKHQNLALKSVVEYLNENHIECPKCHLKFSLSKGGCMHLTCSQCRYEFCSCCASPFSMGLKCKANSPFCAKLGLHAHHPRNCLFYLRDKEPAQLMKLLRETKIQFVGSEESNEETKNVLDLKAIKKKCQVSLQKETPEGLHDEACGQEVFNIISEVCQLHYIEYLGQLIWENRIDPIPILTTDDLETIVKRASKKMPPRSYGTTDEEYHPLLLKVIEDEIPL